jgi:hypothetical protein
MLVAAPATAARYAPAHLAPSDRDRSVDVPPNKKNQNIAYTIKTKVKISRKTMI